MVAQVVQKRDSVPHAVPAHTKMKRANQHAKTAILGRTIQNKDNYLVNHVKKVISAHQRQILNKYALLEHTKMNKAKQRAKGATLGRTVQNKDKHQYPAVNHAKKVISVHQCHKLIKNALLEPTKIK